MKKFLVSNFILFSICANAQTMVDTNKVWNVVECLNNFSYCGTNVYYFGSDTTIGPYTYKKFLVNSDSGNLAPPWRPQAVREDTTTKKIYFYTGGDFLAYDFSLNQGDTFNTNFGGCPFFLVVDSVDTVTLLNGEQRKRMFLSNLWTETWIEGIGSSNGLHYVGVYFCLFDYYPELNCFKENDTLKYQNVNYSDCFYNTVGISEKFFKNNFELFPNPFSEFTILKFENPLQETFTLNVMNADGRTVVKYENISGNDIKIEREQLNNGIYFFQLMNENQIHSKGKLIIQ